MDDKTLDDLVREAEARKLFEEMCKESDKVEERMNKAPMTAGHANNPGYETVSAMRDAMSADVDSDPPPAAPSDDCNSCHTCPRDMPTGADFQRLSDNFMELNSRAEASFDKERLSFERQLRRAHIRLIALEVLIAFFSISILALYIYDVMRPSRGWFVRPTSTIFAPTPSPGA